MIHADNTGKHYSASKHRRRAVVAGVGLAAGAALTAFAALGSAPVAHADTADAAAFTAADWTKIVSNMERVANFGYQDLATGYNEMITGNVPGGLDEYLTGLNNINVGPGLNFLIDVSSVLAGQSVQGTGVFQPFTVPTDLAAAFTDAQTELTHAGTDFTNALTAFFTPDDLVNGVKDALRAFDGAFVLAPEIILVGLAAELPATTP